MKWIVSSTAMPITIAPTIIVVESNEGDRDRTFLSAVAFKEKLEGSENPVLRDAKSIDVLTQSVHARRTLTVYRKVFGEELEIGIISASPGGYDGSDWYKTSEGAKTVITECVALAYEWLGGKDR